MNARSRASLLLGVAFLLQFVTSFSSGVFMRAAWFVTGDMNRTLTNIANNPRLLQANILVDMVTALGIIFLGVMLFVNLRKQDEYAALTALGFYILEAVLLAASRMATFSLIGISQEYVRTGQPAYLLTLGNLAVGSMDYVGTTLHMLAFCSGAILFYYLLYKSGLLPRSLSLWGLIAVIPCLAGTLLGVLGYQAPIYFYLAYVPFELVIGLWILFKGLKEVKI